eukprot:481151_1
MIRTFIPVVLLLFISFSKGRADTNPNAATVESNGRIGEEINDGHLSLHGDYELLKTYPHSDRAFTQGFTLYNGHIYEGTGLRGRSALRKLDPDDLSKAIQTYDIPDEYWGEGITHYKDGRGNDRIIQITWQLRTAFVYDADRMEPLFKFKYHAETSNGEGWGITYDPEGNEFIMSDGTEFLFFWDASSLDDCEPALALSNSSLSDSDSAEPNDLKFCDEVLEPTRQIKVHAYSSSTTDAIPVDQLNELELIPRTSIDGEKASSKHTILANVWNQKYIVEICSITGVVLKIYDLSPLCPEIMRHDVLNGISISGENDHDIYVTGKFWPFAYKIRLK